MALDSKRIASIRIYDILKEHTEEGKILTQAQIASYLEKDYGIVLERKAISNYLHDLETADLGIKVTSKGAYLEDRDFDNSEIRLLIDAVLCSKYISKNQSKEIIDKLCTLSNKYFKPSVKNILTLDTWDKSENQQLFLNIEIINEAINKKKKVEFIYNEYKADKKLHPITSEPYIVTPYQLVLTNGSYYLIGCIDEYDNIFNFKLDRITEIEIATRRNSKSTNLQISEYVKTHPYMYSGVPKRTRLIIKENALSEIIEFFGKDIQISKSTDGYLTVDLIANPDGIYEWGLQHGDIAEVVYPQEVRNRIRSTLYKMQNTYLKNDDDLYDNAIVKAKNTGILSLKNIDLSKRNAHQNLDNIHTIELENNNIDNIDFLNNYPNLQSLSVCNNNVSDFSILKSLKALKNLDIVRTDLEDIQILKECKALEKLELCSDIIEDFSILYDLKGLSELKVASIDYKIDTERLKTNNPKLKVNIQSLNYLLGITDEILEKRADNIIMGPYPVNLLSIIFGDRYYDEHKENTEKLLQDADFLKAMNETVEKLESPIKQVIKYHFEKGFSIREISKVLDKDIEIIADSEAYGLRELRHPKNSRPLAKYYNLLTKGE